jgi:hypothetical protein
LGEALIDFFSISVFWNGEIDTLSEEVGIFVKMKRTGAEIIEATEKPLKKGGKLWNWIFG